MKSLFERKLDVFMKKRPPECTRRRFKPYMSDCECWWCKELDELVMSHFKTKKGRQANA